jgi:hypothetical protein
MSKSLEIKVAEQLVNLTDDHWFNASIFGRYLAEQPLYTSDRIIEMVAYIVHEQAKMHITNSIRGTSSEGLLLANELNECIKAYREVTVINNLRLPAPVSYTIKREEQPKRIQFGWREEKEPFQ